MDSPAAAVLDFHRTFGLSHRTTPVADDLAEVDDGLLTLREGLLTEETAEFVEASRVRDLVGIADALADVVYVAYGTALTYGIDLDLVLAEVHRANMSKLDADGRPVHREDGKVVKSALYEPPAVAAVLDRQRA